MCIRDRHHVGIEHGFIRRIVSPEDIGERLKPFVFLDFTHGKIPDNGGFGFHPHSGIATITYQQAVELTYEDTTGPVSYTHLDVYKRQL